MARELITQAEYARRRGVTRGAVAQAVVRCGIPLIEGKIDPVLADAAWKARTDPEQSRRGSFNRKTPQIEVQHDEGPEDEPAANDWRSRRDRAEAKKGELELQTLLGTLVKSDEVNRRARQLAAALVGMMEAMPDQFAAEFGADEAQRGAMRRRLRQELDRIRTEIARAGLASQQ